jgi:hypothetical protein
VTQQDDQPLEALGSDKAHDIQRQFALLQAEMKRVMADPQAAPPSSPPGAPPADDAAQFRRIESGLQDLRRDADRLRTSLSQPAASDTSAVAALRTATEEIARQSAAIGKRLDDARTQLTRAVQETEDALESITYRLDALERRRPSRWGVSLAILLGAIIIAGAVLLNDPSRMQMLVDRVNALVASIKSHAENAPAPPPVKPAAIVATTMPTPTPAPSVPIASAAPASVAVALPAPAPPKPIAAPPASPPAPAAAAVADPPAPAAAQAPVSAAVDPPAAASQIVLRAKSDTWVEVKNRGGGAALIGRVLHAGETWPVPDQGPLVLSTGNAGGLELLVDGTPAPALGGDGAVRRDIPLDPELIRAGHSVPDPTQRPKPTAANR